MEIELSVETAIASSVIPFEAAVRNNEHRSSSIRSFTHVSDRLPRASSMHERYLFASRDSIDRFWSSEGLFAGMASIVEWQPMKAVNDCTFLGIQSSA